MGGVGSQSDRDLDGLVCVRRSSLGDASSRAHGVTMTMML